MNYLHTHADSVEYISPECKVQSFESLGVVADGVIVTSPFGTMPNVDPTEEDDWGDL